ncbi:hypothetical protein CANCADRAFT_147638 [Tortispora caseinolytica NRRL Y-17796]|uniref:Nucleolar protein 16 n=1 Tax=Tortispora caseinolytica NRRL Y-17796 TaxID=767744 RepID=A0A1E4TLL7_9ASCO|nr:hypothetical protein CANCADRAFT_147638 [Tortispora caseinolytica NRRL Y-17796]
MANPRQKRKNRSSIKKQTRKQKSKHRKVSIKSNPLIAANWDRNETLEQNYQRLGLKSRLGKQTGGVEKVFKPNKRTDEWASSEDENESEAVLKSTKGPKPGTGRIIRHEDGSVTVEYGTYKIDSDSDNNNDNDDDNDSDNDSDEFTGFDDKPVVRALEEQAKNGITKPRWQSDREVEWIQRLVEKHGDNYEAMFRDKKLNIYQQSVGDLKRRVKKYLKTV